MANKKLPITLDEHIFNKLKKLADKNNISMAAQIRYLIAQATSEGH